MMGVDAAARTKQIRIGQACNVIKPILGLDLKINFGSILFNFINYL